MRGLFLLLIPFFLSGCATFYSQPEPVILQDQQDFCQAFSDFQENYDITGLQKLMVNFPESAWSSRAETIILYVRELDQKKTQNKQLRKVERRHTRDLKHLSQQNRQLKKKTKQLGKLNQQLTDKIEQLKNLLIQSEQYPQK
jgi:small-conductance mechanosensitive channel